MGLKMNFGRISLLALMTSIVGFCASDVVRVEAQEAEALAQSRLAHRLAQRAASKQSRPSPRKRPKPVRISGGWFATQRGAGSRLSCANYELMEIVEPSAADAPGFAVRVPYNSTELKDLEFILQTENYEELHRVPLALNSASEALLVELPVEMLNQRSDSAYRWFVEATIVCQSEVDQPVVAPVVATEGESEEPSDVSISDTEIVDTRKSSIGGWIERDLDPANSQSGNE